LTLPLNSGRAWEKDPVGPRTNEPRGTTGAIDVRDANDPRVLAVLKGVTTPGKPAPVPYSLGMERVAYTLAAQLGLPVQETYLDTYNGEACSVQLRVEGHAFKRCRGAPMMITNVTNSALWPLIVAFDVWLANTDRNAENLFLVTIPPGARPGMASGSVSWLIDHGQTGLWPGWKISGNDADLHNIPDNPTVVTSGLLHSDVERHIRTVMFPELEQSWLLAGAAERQQALDAIRGVGDSAIRDATDEVPTDYFTPDQAATLAAFLQARQAAVDTVMTTYW
jgi:hypothetical protein